MILKEKPQKKITTYGDAFPLTPYTFLEILYNQTLDKIRRNV